MEQECTSTPKEKKKVENGQMANALNGLQTMEIIERVEFIAFSCYLSSHKSHIITYNMILFPSCVYLFYEF